MSTALVLYKNGDVLEYPATADRLAGLRRLIGVTVAEVVVVEPERLDTSS